MQPGMITSNEPGLYRPGRWGIRIENLVCNQVAGTSEFGEFLQFETLTLCPIDTRCIDAAQMRPDELAWLDSLENLPEALQSSLVAELATREFLPLIERIEAISDDDPPALSVVTDRGRRRFILASVDDIDRLPDGSAFVVDATGVRYRIANVAALDPTSLRLLEKTME